MDKLKDMQLFVTAVEKGSFSQTAKVAGLTPAMVGRRIAALEAELGFMLFNRTTRRMELTPGRPELLRRLYSDSPGCF